MIMAGDGEPRDQGRGTSMALTRTFMTAAMFTSAESAIAELALVFLLRDGGLFSRRVGSVVGSGRSHFFEKMVRRRRKTEFFSAKRRRGKGQWYRPFRDFTPVLKAD